MTAPRLILGSGSATRRDMLRNVGVTFDVTPADVDEAGLRGELTARNAKIAPADIAAALAAAKALDVSRRHPDALVIGSDQVLDLDGEIFTKPKDAAGVRTTLQRLSGKTHALHAAVALALSGHVVWSELDTARLTMRALSAQFIDSYVASVGNKVRHSVGAYQIEDVGLQLFERIDGDYFTILGMPLLPLLTELRNRGAIPA